MLGVTGGSCNGYNAAFCPLVAASVSFSGIGKSFVVQGVGNQLVLDDISLNAVPEPATWGLMIVGFGVVGAAARRRRIAAVAA